MSGCGNKFESVAEEYNEYWEVYVSEDENGNTQSISIYEESFDDSISNAIFNDLGLPEEARSEAWHDNGERNTYLDGFCDTIKINGYIIEQEYSVDGDTVTTIKKEKQ